MLMRAVSRWEINMPSVAHIPSFLLPASDGQISKEKGQYWQRERGGKHRERDRGMIGMVIVIIKAVIVYNLFSSFLQSQANMHISNLHCLPGRASTSHAPRGFWEWSKEHPTLPHCRVPPPQIQTRQGSSVKGSELNPRCLLSSSLLIWTKLGTLL